MQRAINGTVNCWKTIISKGSNQGLTGDETYFAWDIESTGSLLVAEMSSTAHEIVYLKVKLTIILRERSV